MNDLDPGESVLVFVEVLVDPSVPDGTTISNTATASSTTTDPVLGNNSTTEPPAVNSDVDLMIEKDVNFETGSSSTSYVMSVGVVMISPSHCMSLSPSRLYLLPLGAGMISPSYFTN